jgi:SAM-dependent methyltransferase
MSSSAATFDAAAADYVQQLEHGIALSGESAEYFVEGRVAWLARSLHPLTASQGPARDSQTPAFYSTSAVTLATAATAQPTVLDFGCGVGNASRTLLSRLNARQVIGLDCSAESLRVAASRHPSSAFKWTVDGADIAAESIDVVYTSGVFHHIEPEVRQAELAKIQGWLKPGGLLALFENNPWNPGTQWVMSRIEFDRDAKCLSPLETKQRLTQAGFTCLRTRSLFYFPKPLSWLRPLEKILSLAPLGAQYVVLAQRPQ